MVTLRFVCEECGNVLRGFSVDSTVVTDLSLKIPVCDGCRERAINAAFAEGQEAAKEE